MGGALGPVSDRGGVHRRVTRTTLMAPGPARRARLQDFIVYASLIVGGLALIAVVLMLLH